jgi:hypothetical protein
MNGKGDGGSGEMDEISRDMGVDFTIRGPDGTDGGTSWQSISI